jgi:hypothetical protein
MSNVAKTIATTRSVCEAADVRAAFRAGEIRYAQAQGMVLKVRET